MDFSKPFSSIGYMLGSNTPTPPPPLPPPDSEPTVRDAVSLVWLLKHPRRLSESQLKSAFMEALKRAPTEIESRGQSTLLGDGDWSYLVHQVSSPYVPDPAAAASAIADRRSQILLDHKAWTSVDVYQRPDEGDAYLRLAPLASALGDLTCLGLYCPEHHLLVPYEHSLHYGLRTSQPLNVFQVERMDEIVQVDAGDDDMRRAVLQARDEFPEFRIRQSRPRPGERFYVKAPFAGEHMWIDLVRISGQSIHGHLANEPRNNPGLQIGDAVKVVVSELTDWMIVANGKPILGAFTEHLMQQ